MQKSGSQLGTNQNSKEAVITRVTIQFWQKIWFPPFFVKPKIRLFSRSLSENPQFLNPRIATYAQSYCRTFCESYKEIKLELLWNYLPNMTRIHIVNVSNIFVKIIQGYFQMTSFRKTIHIIYPFVFYVISWGAKKKNVWTWDTELYFRCTSDVCPQANSYVCLGMRHFVYKPIYNL